VKRPRVSRSFVVTSLVVLAAGVGCSLTVDLSGYSDGDGAVADAAEDGAPEAQADGASDVSIDTEIDSASDTTLDTSEEVADSTVADTSDAAADTAPEAAADTAPDAAADTAPDAAADTAPEAAADTAPEATADAADAADAADTYDGNPCSIPTHLGLSEVMVRAVSGTGDTHEWFEIANYDTTCTYDVGGLRVRTLSPSTSDAGPAWYETSTFTVPAGVVLAPGKAMVFADVRATFLADAGSYYTTNGLDTNLVFDLNKTLGGVLVNTSDFQIEFYAPGQTLPLENVTIKTRTTWPLGQSRALPSPCDPLNQRLTTVAPITTSTHWMDTPASVTYQYGSLASDAGATTFYGTPGRKNDISTTCP
jgi:hypothetical protein